jgi:hypothetical protein
VDTSYLKAKVISQSQSHNLRFRIAHHPYSHNTKISTTLPLLAVPPTQNSPSQRNSHLATVSESLQLVGYTFATPVFGSVPTTPSLGLPVVGAVNDFTTDLKVDSAGGAVAAEGSEYP